MATMSGRAEGMAWDAVHRDGDAVLPDGWDELSADERDVFRDELVEWLSMAEAQAQLFADQGARARRLLELAAEPSRST
jgi:hypothetical protein